MNPHAESYYAARFGDIKPRERLRAPHLADVCIVGAGMAGLTAALELAQRGRSVAVVEANCVGWGASGRNGGFVAAGYAEGIEAISRRVGVSGARALFDLSRLGVRMVRENIETFGIAGAETTPGCLRVSRHDVDQEFAALPEKLAASYDYQVEYRPTEKVRSKLRSPVYFQGLLDNEAFHIDPLAYVEGLARACEEAGVRIFEDTPAAALEPVSAGHRVVAGDGHVSAEHIVLCHSAYGRGLHPRLDRTLLPVATYVITTGANPDLLDSAIATPVAVADTRRAGDYYRRLSDGRLLWGGRITTQRAEPRHLAQMLTSDITAIFPQLAGIGIDHAWSGLMAYARHKMPVIGPLDRGLWTATCFGGHGLNTTAMAGRIIAEAIAEGSDRYRLFEPFGMPWGGGVAGRAATQTAYWYYQARDWMEERRAQRRKRY